MDTWRMPEDMEPTGLTLRVKDLEKALVFYRDLLGLEVMSREFPGALFMSAGGYHHHVGANTWAGNRRDPRGATGLMGYSFRIPIGRLAPFSEWLRFKGMAVQSFADRLVVQDPEGMFVEVSGV